jgi:predicted transcriptional regulator of viral defense system
MRRDASELRRELSALALRQAGYFTAGQAREVGYTHQAQRYHVERGNWTHVGRALFRLPDWPEREEDVYVRWRLWSRLRGVVSHQSALSVYRLGDVNPVLVHLTVPRGFRARDPAVALHRGPLPPEDVTEREAGYLITTPERSLLDAAAAELTQEQADAAIADAVEEGLVVPRRLRERSDGFGELAALRVERALSRMGR